MEENARTALTGEQPVDDNSAQEDIADEDVADETIGDTEELSNVKFPNIPVKPDDAEIEKHRKTHWPYRSWCECCNAGRGLGEQRVRGKEVLMPSR